MPEDRNTDAALTALQVSDKGPTDEQRALVDECRMRASEYMASCPKWIAQLESDRDFVEHQFTDMQRRWRDRTERPVVEIHLLNTRIEQQLHDWRAADVGFRVGSATGAGGEDAARMFNALAQRDQREGNFDLVMHAVMEDAISFGLGVGKVMVTKKRGGLDAAGERFWDGTQWSVQGALGMLDRDLKFAHVDPEDVWADPHAREVDRSDMDWLIETRWMTREERDERSPNARKLDLNSFKPATAADRDWFDTGRGPKRDHMVRIALYWRRIWKEQDYVFLPGWESPVRRDSLTDEQSAEVAAAPLEVIIETEREPVVELSVVDGENVLDGPTEYPLTRIPYFFAVGKVVRYGTGEKVPRGMVSLLRGPSKWMSVTTSDLAWKQSTIGIDRVMGSADAFAGHEEDWNNPASQSLILLVNEYEQFPSDGGTRKPVREPRYLHSEQNLAAEMQVVQTIQSLMNAAGGAADAGARVQAEAARSGEAMRGVSAMEAANRSRDIYAAEKNTVNAAARIWLDHARPNYSRTGRKIYVGSESPGEPDEGILVGMPFFRDEDSGEPVHWPFALEHEREVPLPDRAPDGTWLPPGLPMLGMPGPVTGMGAPPGVLPGAGAAPPDPPVTVTIHRFYPLSDRVKVTTYSSGIARLGADAKAMFIERLLSHAGPALPALLKSIVRSVSDVLPMDDVVRALNAVDPTPADPADTNVKGLRGRLVSAIARVSELEAQLEQASAAANQTQAARDIEQMRSTIRAETAQTVAEIKSTTAIAIAEMRSESAKHKVDSEVEQRREQVFVENAQQAQTSSDKEESRAAVEGLKAAAKGADDGGRDRGPAVG